MTEEQIRRLDALDFVWDYQKLKAQQTWMNWYKELENYTRKHGNPHVPRTYSDTKLASWVWIQRQRKSGTLKTDPISSAQVDLLSTLGFHWNAREEQWSDKFNKLKAFAAKHGHCEVEVEKDKDLATWLRFQRRLQATGKLQEERKAMLESIGCMLTAGLVDYKWRQMYEQLKRYRADHGTADVPKRVTEPRKLARWVQKQREMRKQGKLSEHRIEMLDELGLTWKKPRRQYMGRPLR